MSFAGFVFDMIRRDKENRAMRNLRRERLNNRLDKMYKGRHSKLPNTTPEDMEKIAKMTKEKEQSEDNYIAKMTLIILSICIITVSLLVLIFIK